MLSIIPQCRCCTTLTRPIRLRLAHSSRLISSTSPSLEQTTAKVPARNWSIPSTPSSSKPKVVPAPRDWSLPPSSSPKPTSAPPPARDWSAPAASEPTAPGKRTSWGDRAGSRAGDVGSSSSSGIFRRSPVNDSFGGRQDSYNTRPRFPGEGGGGGGGFGTSNRGGGGFGRSDRGGGGFGRSDRDRSEPLPTGFGLASSRDQQSGVPPGRLGERNENPRFGGSSRDDRFGKGSTNLPRRDTGDRTPFGNRNLPQNSAFDTFGKESESAPTPPPGAGALDDSEGGYEGNDGEGVQSLRRGRESGQSRSLKGLLMSNNDEEIVLNRDRRGGKKDPYASDGGKRGGKGYEQEDPNKLKKKKEKRLVVKQVVAEKEVFIPSNVSTARLSSIFGIKIYKLQVRMQRLGLSEDMQRPDYLLSAETACDLAIEFGYNPIIDDEMAFDLVPEPDVEGEIYPLRPPVVTIMGHVDHGKTTLLDALRQTSVAAGEAGGITQHIGAFSVPLSSLVPSSATTPPSDSSITFIDTPGHAAFTAMRARGASVTDIVVLVVAADDGVMPQTREVLNLVKSEGDKVGLVVAINKVDKPGVDVTKLKSALGAEGIMLEEDGGDTPSVRVSGLAKLGLDELVETLSTLAELRELRARSTGQAEGYVLESNVDRGRGAVATVLITRGTLRTGDSIIAGHTFCRVRQMLNDKGEEIHAATPGMPISMSGWRDLPVAGDLLLASPTGEEAAKRAVNNRIREAEKQKVIADAEVINVKRKEERLAHEQKVEELKAVKDSGGNVYLARQEAERREKASQISGMKELRLVIKGDVSGTVQAVVGALEGIGNKEAKVRIIHTGVGDVNESDVVHAEASDATVIGFNVPATKTVQSQAASLGVDLHLESVIYRLIETVRAKTAALLPPRIESRTNGEATVLQLFPINLKKKQTMLVAGCRCGNGLIKKTDPVRILRGPARTQVYEGTIESLKHLKKEVTEIRKGMECGIAFKDFEDIHEGDEVVCFTSFEVAREL